MKKYPETEYPHAVFKYVDNPYSDLSLGLGA